MPISDLSLEEQSLYNAILSNDIISFEQDLIHSENPSILSKDILNKLKNIIKELGQIWNNEHDLQGNLTTEKESLSEKDFETFYNHVEPLFELLRSRFQILRSEKRIAVGTLINMHFISQLIELNLREQGYLTYYWGSGLKTDDIKEKMESNPINILVLSCMAVNSEFNCFEELEQLRNAFPDLKIIIGGSAFPMFLVLKDNKNHPALTKPYTNNPSYYEQLLKSSDLKEFVSKVFNVVYCETVKELVQEIEKYDVM